MEKKLWHFNFFRQNIIDNWHELEKTKPDNYNRKARAIYKNVHGIDRLTRDFDLSSEEDKEANCNYAWTFYKIASTSALNVCVLGPEFIRQRSNLLWNFGIASRIPHPSTVKAQLKSTNEKLQNVNPASTTVGAVLAEKFWWPLFNDAWILGSAHHMAAIHLHTPASYGEFIKDDTIWDVENKRPRVLGRELIALHALGYRRIKHPHESELGLVFGSSDTRQALNGNFGTICAAVKKFSSAKSIKDLIDFFLHYHNFSRPIQGRKFLIIGQITGYEYGLIQSMHNQYQFTEGTLEVTGHFSETYWEARITNGKGSHSRTGYPTKHASNISGTFYFLIEGNYNLRPI